MIIERTNDMALVKSILTTDGIWEMIGGKGLEKKDLIPDKNWLHAVGIVDGDVVGMVIVHDTPEGDKKCHVQIIPKHRKEHSKEFGVKGMRWIWENTDIQRMVATIPIDYPNVRDYAEKQGFVVYETKPEKDGIIWLLEINRS